MPLVLLAMEASPVLAIDTETTGLDVRYGTDYAIGICWSNGEQDGYIPLRSSGGNVSMHWVKQIEEILAKTDLVWHNQKFDWHSLKTLGMEPARFRGRQYDTLLIAHLIDEEMYSKELDWLCKKFLGEGKDEMAETIHKMGQLYGYEKVPNELMGPYGAKDATLTYRLWRKLWPLLEKQGLASVYWDTEGPTANVLYRYEQRAVGVNQDLSSRMAERGRARMGTIRRQLRFNPASPVDLGHYLLDELGLPVLGRTEKGAPSFAKAIMEEYDLILQQSKNPTAKLVAEYRGWQKATTSLYEPLMRKVGPDGRIRCNYKQHGTVTGRLSCEDPNLQQIPRGSDKPWNGNAKSCFNAGREGYSLYGWDYSQLELRLAAAYGRESLLLREFENPDADPFKLYCVILFEYFSKEGRQDTKTFFYANLYGAQLARIAATLGWSESKTKPIFDRFQQSIPGIQATAKAFNRAMAKDGHVTYWDGRRRHIRNRSEAYKTWNSVVQGGGAQIVKRAMIACEAFADDDCYPVMNVHDEISFIVRTEAIPDYEPKIIKAMTDFPQFAVKFHVEGKEWK